MGSLKRILSKEEIESESSFKVLCVRLSGKGLFWKQKEHLENITTEIKHSVDGLNRSLDPDERIV